MISKAITSSMRRARWVANTLGDMWRVQRRLGIASADLVLDVGSGGHPNPRANILCDKFISDGAERHGTALVADRPFIVGDVTRLPFADKAFDFVICSHLLEHVLDPAAAIAELQRVGRRGYIETPSAEWEKLAGFPFHRWLVSLRDGELIFERKSAPLEDEPLRYWFARLQQQLGIEDRVWLARHRIGVYTWLLWEGEVPYHIIDREIKPYEDRFVSAELNNCPNLEHAEISNGPAAQVLSLVGRRLRAASMPSARRLAALLRCPACRGELRREQHFYHCLGCENVYPVDNNGRPWLIVERSAR